MTPPAPLQITGTSAEIDAAWRWLVHQNEITMAALVPTDGRPAAVATRSATGWSLAMGESIWSAPHPKG
jgi:hypothetical protein